MTEVSEGGESSTCHTQQARSGRAQTEWLRRARLGSSVSKGTESRTARNRISHLQGNWSKSAPMHRWLACNVAR